MAFIRRITIIESDGSTRSRRVGKKRKRRVTKGLKPLERAQRKTLSAAKRFTSVLDARNRRSNRKKRDGFLRDVPKNQAKALRKALKKLR